MQNNKLKAELFLQLSNELLAEGATELNTEVVVAQEVPPAPGRFAKFLRKIEGRFVTLVGKWGSLGFILFLTLVQSVPERTPIYAPSAGDAVFTTAPSADYSVDFYKIDPSGSAELWISQYGQNRPVPPPTEGDTYVPCVGDKVLFMPPGSNPPANYFRTVTGSFAG